MRRREQMDLTLNWRRSSEPDVVRNVRRPNFQDELRRLSGDVQRGICGMHYCGWNGGWAFYCACGFCTPLAKSFSQGLDWLEQHWERQDARLAELEGRRKQVQAEPGQRLDLAACAEVRA